MIKLFRINIFENMIFYHKFIHISNYSNINYYLISIFKKFFLKNT